MQLMKPEKIQTLKPHQALQEGADLWALSHQKHSKKWNVQIDWYMNFLITKSVYKKSPSLNERRKSLLKRYKVIEFQRFSKNKQFHQSPLLIKSSSYLPNLLTLIVNDDHQWLFTVYNVWCSLKKPSLRIFAPQCVSKKMCETIWGKETQNVQFIQD